MSKKSQLDRAIEKLENERDVRDLAIQCLKEQQTKRPAKRGPRAVKAATAP